MRSQDMSVKFNQVRLRSVTLVFTTKYYDSGRPGALNRSDVQKWESVGPREVRHFVYPKVVLYGPSGLKSYTLTCLNPHSEVATQTLKIATQTLMKEAWKPSSPGRTSRKKVKTTDTEIENAFVNCALGKAQKVPEEHRTQLKYSASILKSEIESRIMSGCRGVGLTQKVKDIWRKARREQATKGLQAYMEKNFEILTDYDVKEAWKTVKRTRAVQSVMES